MNVRRDTAHATSRLSPAWRACLRRAPFALALMGLIFLQSSQPGVLGDLGVFNLILSSVAHVLMFGLLAAVLWWVLKPVSGWALLIAVVVAGLYGVSDEIHQSFVATRTASVADVGFDFLGAALAALLIRRSRSTGGQSGPRLGKPRTEPQRNPAREAASVPATTPR
jgi:hypothetical protein